MSIYLQFQHILRHCLLLYSSHTNKLNMVWACLLIRNRFLRKNYHLYLFNCYHTIMAWLQTRYSFWPCLSHIHSHNPYTHDSLLPPKKQQTRNNFILNSRKKHVINCTRLCNVSKQDALHTKQAQHNLTVATNVNHLELELLFSSWNEWNWSQVLEAEIHTCCMHRIWWALMIRWAVP